MLLAALRTQGPSKCLLSVFHADSAGGNVGHRPLIRTLLPLHEKRMVQWRPVTIGVIEDFLRFHGPHLLVNLRCLDYVCLLYG